MRKFTVLTFLTATTICTNLQAQRTDAVINYIEKFKEIAITEELRTGIPASITLAQGILESNAGQSSLVQESNNHFGIKCKNDWTGNVVYHDDDRPNECFRSYSSAADSYRDHSDFLKTRSNYSFLFDIDPLDYEGWAYGLKKAGYATNPAYAQLLISTIENFNLEQFTFVAMLREGIDLDLASVPQLVKESTAGAHIISQPVAYTSKLTEEKNSINKAYPAGVFSINNTKVIYAAAGTSLLAVASNYHVSYKKLLRYNDLPRTETLQKDMLIYLQKKPKANSKGFHVVSVNENIEDIAQAEGVQLESLRSYNHMPTGMQPKAGDRLSLNNDSRKLSRL